MEPDNIENTVTEIKGRKISVTFERKKDLGNYENVVARAWVEDELPAHADGASVSEKVVELTNALKAGVYDSLGIELFMDDSGVIREKHAPVATVKAAQDAVGSAFKGTQAFDTGGLKIMNSQDLQEDVPADIVAKCNELGITAIWRNNGQYGVFYKEAVARGETPKLPDQRDPSKGGIIKP